MTPTTFDFDATPPGPPDVMFDLKNQADADHSAQKVDLGVGVYRNERGGYYELPTVRKAKKMLEEQNLGHDYEVTTGSPIFLNEAAKLLFGKDCDILKAGKIASVQSISGTGANHLGAMFTRRFYANDETKVYIGTPAWGNYEPLFRLAGHAVETYKAYDNIKKQIDFEAVLTKVRTVADGSIFVLQACCSNPTGADFSRSQWTQLVHEIQLKKHLPFFDIAYQGFGAGMEEDVWALREFARSGFPMIVCQSFSKNMGLYGERVGALHVVTSNKAVAANVADQLRCIIRWEFSSSPAYGSRLATIILTSEKLKATWLQDVEAMRRRLLQNRGRLHTLLTRTLKTPGDWGHLLREQGLFSFLSLNKSQISLLCDQHHIYLPPNGRINIAGLNDNNIEKFAKVLDHIVRTIKRDCQGTTSYKSFIHSECDTSKSALSSE